jgi:hypothetical protein
VAHAFASFDDVPAAAASIGQVHRAVWHDGRDVAVKVQYPGAGDALLSDLDQIGRLGRLVGGLVPGLDIKPLIAELKARVVEELDYSLEAEAQEQFAAAYDGDAEITVPHVVASSEHVIVSEWLEGTPLSRIIARGSQSERDRVGLLYVRFLFSGPARAGLLHADPHPGNYRVLPDGRLGVLDFGACARLPDGLPPQMGVLLSTALRGDAETVVAGLRAEGFLKPQITVDPQALLDYLAPFVEPASVDRFRFSRDWMRSAVRSHQRPTRAWLHHRAQANMPPSYLLIHRVWLGGIGVLSQLGAEAPFSGELERWLRASPRSRGVHRPREPPSRQSVRPASRAASPAAPAADGAGRQRAGHRAHRAGVRLGLALFGAVVCAAGAVGMLWVAAADDATGSGGRPSPSSSPRRGQRP